MGPLLGVGDAVDNDSVDGIGSFVTRTDSTTPVNKEYNYKAPCIMYVDEVYLHQK